MLADALRALLQWLVQVLQWIISKLPAQAEELPISQWTLPYLEALAERRLPEHVWKYYSYASGQRITQRRIVEAFDNIELNSRAMAGLSPVDTSIDLFGSRLSSPVLVAPTAFHKLAHDDGEMATVRAASSTGSGYVYPFMLSTTGVREIASVQGPKWAHVYILKDREYTLHCVKKAEQLGFDALVITCDHPHERVKRHTLPQFEAHRDEPIRGVSLMNRMVFPNADEFRRLKGLPTDDDSIGENDSTLSWADVAWLVQRTSLPVVCKGILSPEDAKLAVQSGARGLIVSNHGCRQMDGTPPNVSVLPSIVEAVRGVEDCHVPILLDSGVRTGAHVLKALALGADAVLVGRPVLWGLAAAGEQGVEWLLSQLRQDLADDMACVGCSTVQQIGPHVIHKRGKLE